MSWIPSTTFPPALTEVLGVTLTNQITNRWITLSHLGQHFFGGNSAIHHPNPIGLAVLCFDFLEESSQGGFVRSIARQNFVSDGEAFGRNHKGYYHLHTVIPFITTVTKFALVLWLESRIALKIGAGQIINQHLKATTKEIFQALL